MINVKDLEFTFDGVKFPTRPAYPTPEPAKPALKPSASETLRPEQWEPSKFGYAPFGCADRCGVKGSYMRSVYERGWLAAAVDRVDLQLGELREHFDTIAFTGQSGSAIAYPLGVRGWPLTCVRKRSDNSHVMQGGSHPVEGVIGPRLRYIIVDEQICTGNTVRRIQEEIKDACPSMTCIGVLVYMKTLYWEERNNVEPLECWECLP